MTQEEAVALFEFIWELEGGCEHCCPDCLKDVSAGRMCHKPDCLLLKVIEVFKIPECPY